MTPDVLGPLVGMAAVIGFFVTVGMNIRRLRLRETPGGENFERLPGMGGVSVLSVDSVAILIRPLR